MRVSNSKFLLCSKSAVKMAACEKMFGYKPDTVSVENCSNPEQPVGSLNGLICAKQRVQFALKADPRIAQKYTHVFSIESGIEREKDVDGVVECCDVVHVVVFDTCSGVYFYYQGSKKFQFEESLWEETRDDPNNAKSSLGWSLTVGEVVERKFGYNKKNWSKDYTALGEPLDRVEQIYETLREVWDTKSASSESFRPYRNPRKTFLMANIDYYVDNPKQGVIFQVISWNFI